MTIQTERKNEKKKPSLVVSAEKLGISSKNEKHTRLRHLVQSLNVNSTERTFYQALTVRNYCRIPVWENCIRLWEYTCLCLQTVSFFDRNSDQPHCTLPRQIIHLYYYISKRQNYSFTNFITKHNSVIKMRSFEHFSFNDKLSGFHLPFKPSFFKDYFLFMIFIWLMITFQDRMFAFESQCREHFFLSEKVENFLVKCNCKTQQFTTSIKLFKQFDSLNFFCFWLYYTNILIPSNILMRKTDAFRSQIFNITSCNFIIKHFLNIFFS